MSARDTAPYLEPTDRLPDGIQLHAAHNITDQQVDIIRRALKNHRTTLSTIIRESGANPESLVNKGLNDEMASIDNLILNLYHIRP